LRPVRHALASEPLAEGSGNRRIGETPATVVLVILNLCAAEARSDIARAMECRYLTAQLDIQAVHWKFNLNDVWEVALGCDIFTAAEAH